MPFDHPFDYQKKLSIALDKVALYENENEMVRAYNELADKNEELLDNIAELKDLVKQLRVQNQDNKRYDRQQRKKLKEQFQKKLEKVQENYEAELKVERIDKKDQLALASRSLKEKEEELSESEQAVKYLTETLATAISLLLEDQGTVQRLQAQLHQNSETCSMPTSANRYGGEKKSQKKEASKNEEEAKKPTEKKHTYIPNNREQTDRKAGGQPGHDGKTLLLSEDPDSVETIPPLGECQDPSLFEPLNEYLRVQVHDIDITGIIKEYRSYLYRNLETGEIVSAPFPEKLKGPVSYGDNLKAFAMQLHTHGNMTYDKVAETICDLTDGKIRPSKATLCNLEKEFSEKALPELTKIEEELLKSDSLHADGTTVPLSRELPFPKEEMPADDADQTLDSQRVSETDTETDDSDQTELEVDEPSTPEKEEHKQKKGKKNKKGKKDGHKKPKKTSSNKENVLIITNGEWNRYTHHCHKGGALAENSILPLYHKCLIHDAESTFFHYGNSHQCCIFHETRYLNGVEVTEEEWGITWASKMRALLFECTEEVKAAKSQKLTALAPDRVEYYHTEYKNILALAETEYEKIPDSVLEAASRQQDGLHVSSRLTDNENYLLYCLDHTDIDFHNNLAENRGRVCKIHGKQSGGFKSREAVGYYCDCVSVLTSAHAQGKSRFKVIREIISRSKSDEAAVSVL